MAKTLAATIGQMITRIVTIHAIHHSQIGHAGTSKVSVDMTL